MPDPNDVLLADVDIEEFEIGSAMVAYDTTKLGGTDGAPTLSVEKVYRDVKCDQGGETVLAKFLVGYDVKVKAKFKQISTALGVLMPGGKLSASEFGKNLIIENGKPLTVAGLKRSFTLPVAIPTGNWEYPISGTEEHGIEIEFSGFKGTDGTFLQYVEAGG